MPIDSTIKAHHNTVFVTHVPLHVNAKILGADMIIHISLIKS